MVRKTEIKNKAWYDLKAEQLNGYVCTFQRSNPRPFVFCKVPNSKNRIFKIMDAYGMLFTSEAQLRTNLNFKNYFLNLT